MEVKINEDQFLGKQELNRFKKSIVQSGYKREFQKFIEQYGIVELDSDIYFNNLKVKKGSSLNKLSINAGIAIDSNSSFVEIPTELTDFFTLSSVNTWYYVILTGATTSEEVGTVNISIDGTIVGTGTYFTEVLRGQPNFPVKIKFPSSINNTLEYEVLSVTNNTNMKIAGASFIAETGLKYVVVGTFTPGISVPSGNKNIYLYDYYSLSLSTTDTVLPGFQFVLAKVKYYGGQLSIIDKRWNYLCSLKKQKNLNNINNLLIGVEYCKWDTIFSTKIYNEIGISWGFRSSSWTINNELGIITIISGNGGKFKDTSYFTDGDFNGWRLYAKNGTYRMIYNSVKSSSQINLYLKGMDSEQYTSGDELVIVPDVEEIEFKLKSGGDYGLFEQIENNFVFPVNENISKIHIQIPSSTVEYGVNVKYRYKYNDDFSIWRILPSDSVGSPTYPEAGYYDETSFEANGVLKTNPLDRNRKLYTAHLTNGYIKLLPHETNYYNVINKIDKGDLPGVEMFTLTGAVPVVDFKVGVKKQYQYIIGSLSLGANLYLNLKTEGAVDGNKFILHFRNLISLNGHYFRIVQDYVNPSTYTLLRTITKLDSELINSTSGLFLSFVFNGTNWLYTGYTEKLAGLTNYPFNIVYGEDLSVINAALL